MKEVHYETEMEFINEVVDDCLLHMAKKDKEYIIRNPRVLDYHFTYCMYIRNQYIYNRDFSNVSFFVEPDSLSAKIMRLIVSKLLPEYEFDNLFIEELYNDIRFINLRKEYKDYYGEYPTDIVLAHTQKLILEDVHFIRDLYTNQDVDWDKKLKIAEKNRKIVFEEIEDLLEELVELVWRTEEIEEVALECGISYDDISKNIQVIKKIFYEEGEYIPLEVCLLPYKKQIGSERYIQYTKVLVAQLKENPHLIENLDTIYFEDRVLAKSVLRYGWPLQYLTMYQNDTVMMRYVLKHHGAAIRYASEQFQKNREWAKFAIQHSHNSTIMYLECMKPYRKDKELVYLACKVDRWNFVYVDKSYRNDFELAKLCMEQINNSNSIFSYMSKSLRDNKELALVNLQEKNPDIEHYSARLRNDDEIAERLFELHGTDFWVWYHMSKRLKKKYGIVDSQC